MLRISSPLALAALATLVALSPAPAQDEDPNRVTRPSGTTAFAAPAAELEALGATLFVDESLGTNGMSCPEPADQLAQVERPVAGAHPAACRRAVPMCLDGAEGVEGDRGLRRHGCDVGAEVTMHGDCRRTTAWSCRSHAGTARS